ncbi:BRO-N domain-containing protein [Sphingobium sp. TomMM35A]
MISEGDGFAWLKGEAHTSAVSESGLYKLIMRSDKPEAMEFQSWVAKVVLPSIRKTGGTPFVRMAPYPLLLAG